MPVGRKASGELFCIQTLFKSIVTPMPVGIKLHRFERALILYIEYLPWEGSRAVVRSRNL